MRASDFDYDLPAERIAQEPVCPRDRCRLMVLDRRTGRRSHHVFAELPELLARGDVLVVNDTRVIPARFLCRRRSGGRIQGLFLRELSPGQWEVMLKAAGRCRRGEELILAGEETVRLKLGRRLGEGLWHLGVHPPAGAMELLERVGRTPLPPYIRRPGAMDDRRDRAAYQTVYAARPGAVAAPTAGMHFTAPLLSALAAAGVERVAATLHVGLGTFAPVKGEDLARHRMQAEWYELSPAAADAIAGARRAGRRIVAVGTTAVRVLETAAEAGRLRPGKGWTDLFIYPPAEFGLVDALLTNFHLPRSTLLMLAGAFCSPGRTEGVRVLLDAYAEAVRMRYRFYSYGDAMLIR